jgi:hypothetical protein
LLEEREQRLRIVARHISTIGAARKTCEDLLRARLFVRHALRFAGEDAPPAWRVAGAARIERAGQDHFVDVRTAREIDRVRRAALVVFEPPRVQRVCLLEERDSDRSRTGLERHARREAIVYRIAGRRRVVA